MTKWEHILNFLSPVEGLTQAVESIVNRSDTRKYVSMPAYSKMPSYSKTPWTIMKISPTCWRAQVYDANLNERIVVYDGPSETEARHMRQKWLNGAYRKKQEKLNGN